MPVRRLAAAASVGLEFTCEANTGSIANGRRNLQLLQDT